MQKIQTRISFIPMILFWLGTLKFVSVYLFILRRIVVISMDIYLIKRTNRSPSLFNFHWMILIKRKLEINDKIFNGEALLLFKWCNTWWALSPEVQKFNGLATSDSLLFNCWLYSLKNNFSTVIVLFEESFYRHGL